MTTGYFTRNYQSDFNVRSFSNFYWVDQMVIYIYIYKYFKFLSFAYPFQVEDSFIYIKCGIIESRIRSKFVNITINTPRPVLVGVSSELICVQNY